MQNFLNKVVVITGAGSGMGRAYAIAFAKQGARLALNDYDQAALDETQAILNQQSVIYAEAFDVSDKLAMQSFADNVQSTFGNAHVVINNAGIEGDAKPVFELEDNSFERLMQVNYFGVVNGTKAFLPQLVANEQGAIVNVSSIFGLVGTPNHADYCAAKFAVRGFTESLMAEFQNSPIQIHCVHPGGIDTNIARSAGSQDFADKYLTTPPEKIARHVIKCIQKNKPKIVYGKDSYKTWAGANLVPQKWLSKLIWRDMRGAIDVQDYKKFSGRGAV